MTIPKDNSKLNRARELRKEMTPQERHLWYDFLRNYPVKVYKQRIIGSYIVDFYCASAKLVIEIDGSQHYDAQAQAYDSQRTAFLESVGLRVIRFPMQISMFDFRQCVNVLMTLFAMIRSKPSPSALAGCHLSQGERHSAPPLGELARHSRD